MRYLNWDVLIFPEGSKTPIQEFKTGCYVVQDTDTAQVRSLPANYMVTPHLPAVTCFIPSLPAGFAFRVSIHSWEPPCHSAEAIVSGHEILIFEARVFVDGVFVSSMLFSDKGPWPQVLDWACGLDKDGNTKPLAFPVFHSEILTQSWWSAGQDLGRVKVVISEGFARGHPELPFERIKNTVVFSFQHAPQEILEASGVAWPNPGIWQQMYLPHYIARSRSPHNTQNHDHEARARASLHLEPTSNAFNNIVSPQSSFSAASGRSLASLVALSKHPLPVSQVGTPTYPAIPWVSPDPFHDNSQFLARWHLENRSSSGSSLSATTASSRRTTGSFAQSVNQNSSSNGTPHNPCIEQVLEDSSSRNGSESSIVSATNSRRGSSASTSVHPPPSAAAEARAASYANRKASGARQASSIRNERVISDMSIASRLSEEQSGNEQKENTDPVIRVVPAKAVRGKKEGKDRNEFETPQANPDTIKLASKRNEPTSSSRPNSANAMAPKRKRSQPTLGKKAVRSDPVPDVDVLSSSPTRKFSKGGPAAAAAPQSGPTSSQSNEVVDFTTSKDTRMPLGRIENVRQG